MSEDIRNHDPKPTDEEAAWMRTNPFAVLARLAVLAGIAAAIGLSATITIDPHQKPDTTAAAGAAAESRH